MADGNKKDVHFIYYYYFTDRSSLNKNLIELAKNLVIVNKF